MLGSALYGLLARIAPDLRYPWLPSALFLTGFPQMNWGYHLLTDTIGYATSFVAAMAAWAILESDRRRLLDFAGLFVLQSLAFLARETAWMVPIVVGWLLIRGGLPRERRGFGLGVLATVLLAYLPRVLYAKLVGVTSIALPLAPDVWLDPGYVLDFAVKSAVAFNLLWVLAAWGSRGGGIRAVPHLIAAWGLAAVAYMAAGYAHNSLAQIGYPLRLTYALFPLVFFLAARGLEANVRGDPRTSRRPRACGLERRRGCDWDSARSGRERDYSSAPDPTRGAGWPLSGAEVSSSVSRLMTTHAAARNPAYWVNGP